MVKLLLANDACDVAIVNHKQITCLMMAAYADRPAVVTCLVAAGCDMRRVDSEGRNVLFYAVAAGKVDTLAYLLDQGAELITDKHG